MSGKKAEHLVKKMCQKLNEFQANILSEVSNQVNCYIWFPI